MNISSWNFQLYMDICRFFKRIFAISSLIIPHIYTICLDHTFPNYFPQNFLVVSLSCVIPSRFSLFLSFNSFFLPYIHSSSLSFSLFPFLAPSFFLSLTGSHYRALVGLEFSSTRLGFKGTYHQNQTHSFILKNSVYLYC